MAQDYLLPEIYVPATCYYSVLAINFLLKNALALQTSAIYIESWNTWGSLIYLCLKIFLKWIASTLSQFRTAGYQKNIFLVQNLPGFKCGNRTWKLSLSYAVPPSYTSNLVPNNRFSIEEPQHSKTFHENEGKKDRPTTLRPKIYSISLRGAFGTFGRDPPTL